ncbi:MAG TPA: hypothetical protein VMG40_19555 [Bryobacteraceae bacterium]|nr:hypothetical protein [Bryobacteraceae bacterium]
MRRKISREEKLLAIEKLERGEPVAHPKMVRRWREERQLYGEKAFSGYGRRRAATPLKTEPVVLRLTHQEYDRLRAFLESNQARSFSEFARAQLFSREPSPRQIEQKINDLKSAIARLISKP